jgi:hypothetical protein
LGIKSRHHDPLVDHGKAIKPYYGDEAGDKLTGLLKGHILGAVDILKSAKVGNSTGAADAEKKWYDNADEIATFLEMPRLWCATGELHSVTAILRKTSCRSR